MAPLLTITPSANLCEVLHNFVDICIRKQNFAELTPVHPHDAIDAAIRLRLDGSRIGSGSSRIIARSLIHLGCRHLPCDVSWFANAWSCALMQPEGLSVEPSRTELGVGRAMA